MNTQPQVEYEPPAQPYICIIHRDDDLLVVSKPSGLLSVPGKDPAHKDCMERRARKAHADALITHRLDMDTSGIMVMARNKAAQRHISRQFEQRQIKKTYMARVWGKPEKKGGRVDLPLICDWPNRPLQKVCYEHGKPSQTDWEVMQQDDSSALIKLTPLTGRSHQLRVHMMEIGHPILGDKFYAHDQALAASPRLALHASAITLRHPRNERVCTFCDDITF